MQLGLDLSSTTTGSSPSLVPCLPLLCERPSHLPWWQAHQSEQTLKHVVPLAQPPPTPTLVNLRTSFSRLATLWDDPLYFRERSLHNPERLN